MAIKYQEQLDRIFHALGDGTRRSMLTLIAQRGQCTAGELGEPFAISQPTVSKHLRVLEQAGLLTRQVTGRRHRFHLNVTSLQQAQEWISRHREFWQGTLDRLGGFLDDLDP